MNKLDISCQKILTVATALIQESPTDNLNMRTLAKLCGVSVGSIYNYFPTKADLLVAIVEDIWRKMFHPQFCNIEADMSFIDTITTMYQKIHDSKETYGSFFWSHRTMITKNSREQGKSTMEQYFEHMKKALLYNLESDKLINKKAFTETFTPQDVIDLVLSSMLTAKEKNFKILMEVLKKALYSQNPQ